MSEYNNDIKCAVTLANRPNAFAVVRVEGREALSDLFDFTCVLYARNPANIPAYVGKDASLSLTGQPGGSRTWYGVTASLKEITRTSTGYLFEARIRPHAWWLTLSEHSRVFLAADQTDANPGDPIKTVLGKAMSEGGLPPANFSLAGLSERFKRRYVCQYQESHFDFCARWLAFVGAWYAFDHASGTDVLTVKESGDFGSLPAPVEYSENFGLDPRHGKLVYSLAGKRNLVPARVLVRDYNPERPDQNIEGTAAADPNGDGDCYIYGDHVKTVDEAGFIAEMRAQEFLCRKKEFEMRSTVAEMAPGKLFTLRGHGTPAMNRAYRIESVTHEINHAAALVQYLKADLADMGGAGATYYRNTLICLEADPPYRPVSKQPWPRLAKVISAHVETEGSKEYAQLDAQGRYRVRLPFDIEGYLDGKASCMLHMGKPYAGNGSGMHFPLPAGTEVMLGFIEGHPDRPYITAAIPNPKTPSPRTDKNQTSLVITSLVTNRIVVEDKKGSEHILMESTPTGALVQYGAVPKGQTTGNEKGVYETTGSGGSYIMTIGGHAEYNTVGKHTEEVLSGDYILTVKKNRDEYVKSNYTETVTGGTTFTGSSDEYMTSKANYTLTTKNNHALTVAGYNNETVQAEKKVKAAKEYSLSAATFIRHQVTEKATFDQPQGIIAGGLGSSAADAAAADAAAADAAAADAAAEVAVARMTGLTPTGILQINAPTIKKNLKTLDLVMTNWNSQATTNTNTVTGTYSQGAKSYYQFANVDAAREEIKSDSNDFSLQLFDARVLLAAAKIDLDTVKTDVSGTKITLETKADLVKSFNAHIGALKNLM